MSSSVKAKCGCCGHPFAPPFRQEVASNPCTHVACLQCFLARGTLYGGGINRDVFLRCPVPKCLKIVGFNNRDLVFISRVPFNPLDLPPASNQFDSSDDDEDNDLNEGDGSDSKRDGNKTTGAPVGETADSMDYDLIDSYYDGKNNDLDGGDGGDPEGNDAKPADSMDRGKISGTAVIWISDEEPEETNRH
ncbi:Oidioi.mRNA.OKI2018_I69.chr2.g7151.t1.cds [Oikopleura dioica]|uniref:Oidioi.mRNA.OKI2018_I69.chr2.g7151.t1.cds n=1 Tax=Oikopleura dioica TaxID=34765 RepID=A0ABN7TBZ9_OIKDI|nr:Oidioi.mRNA.OKI2018_I69.chr2.g7151.t1.cds [Oikopleura dioica]